MQIDLNADLGEGFGVWRLTDDQALLAIVTSANVACGFHAGDPITMRRVCAWAAERGVRVGAQVSYRDLAGFGRRRMEIDGEELSADVLYQLGALAACAQAAGTRVSYVKPHGALYNTAADDPGQAMAVAAAVAAYDRSLPLLGLPGSALTTAAAAHELTFVAEAFADRAYRADGRLVARTEPGAVRTDPGDVIGQALSIVEAGVVTSQAGTPVPVVAASLCLHGDTPGAVTLAQAVRAALADAGVQVAAFTE